MNKILIYLAHALSSAPEGFRQRMIVLRDRLDKIPDVEVLRFAWENGVPKKGIANVWVYDQHQVARADLLVAVDDFASCGMGCEIQTRCQIFGPLMVFHPNGTIVSRYVSDCIVFHQNVLRQDGCPLEARDMFDPIIYDTDDAIVLCITDWVRGYIPRRKLNLPEFGLISPTNEYEPPVVDRQ